jgi:hypothetical protein
LERPLAEVDDEAVPPEQRGLLAVRGLVGGVLPPSEDGVQHEADREQRPDDDR